MAQPLPAPVSACLQDAVARSAQLLACAVEAASLSLQEEAQSQSGNPREWRHLQDAALELARRGRCARAAFPAALQQALDTAAQPGQSARPAATAGTLTLVEDGEIALSIETARLVQQLAPRLEMPLAELDALMSAALGLQGIQPGRNPLRPAVIAGELRRCLLEPAPEEADWPAAWLRHLAGPLAQQLEQLYRAATRRLEQAGVVAAAYRLVSAPAPLTAPPQAAAGGASAGAAGDGAMPVLRAAATALAAPASGWFQSAAQLLRGPVLRDFLSGGRHLPLQQPLDAGWYSQVEQELGRLEAGPETRPPPPEEARRHAHLPPVDRPVRPVGTGSALDPSHWGTFAGPRQRSLVLARTKQRAGRIEQALGIELVHRFVDEVAQDPRLLAPVREAVVALEPALARLALDVPRFVGQPDHPGRGLLEGVADRSLRYNDEFDPAFERFIAPVREQFNRLNRDEAAAVETAFARALHELHTRWAAEDRSQAERQQAVLEAVRFAERRQAEAEVIARILARRSDLDGTPAVVQTFLFDAWALVLAQARLQACEGAVDPGGYLAVVADLLWSAKPKQAMREPARAFALIPPLLARLREGLALIGRTPADNEPFFGALEQLHAPVLRLRALTRQQGGAAPPSAKVPPSLAPVPALTPQPAHATWLAPSEQQACGLQDEAAGPDRDSDAESSGEAGTAALADALAEGSWVDLDSRGQWRRARLVWRGTRGTLFMFVGLGGEPYSMTRRLLQGWLQQRRLRPVDGGEVVQQALQSLALPAAQPLAA